MGKWEKNTGKVSLIPPTPPGGVYPSSSFPFLPPQRKRRRTKGEKKGKAKRKTKEKNERRKEKEHKRIRRKNKKKEKTKSRKEIKGESWKEEKEKEGRGRKISSPSPLSFSFFFCEKRNKNILSFFFKFKKGLYNPFLSFLISFPSFPLPFEFGGFLALLGAFLGCSSSPFAVLFLLFADPSPLVGRADCVFWE